MDDAYYILNISIFKLYNNNNCAFEKLQVLKVHLNISGDIETDEMYTSWLNKHT